MALASASEAAVDFDVDGAVASFTLFGGRRHPLSVALPLLQSLRQHVVQALSHRTVGTRFTPEENIVSAVMKIVQACSERIMERNTLRLCHSAELDPRTAYLATAGGFALNSVTNSRLVEKFGFRGLLSPPNANDGGQALGLGLLALYTEGTFGKADFALRTAYVGRRPRTDRALQDFGPFIESVTEYTSERFAQDIKGQPVAWVDGAAEVGPRALGHRSLLGDPTSLRTKELLNEWKQRQWWRPVAPVVLAEQAVEWFEFERPSPFMLEVAEVRMNRRDRVPAVVHLDGSARLQTLSASDNPRLHGAIEAFHRATGVPMLCNTSLNDKGEPIVDSASDALHFCLRKGVRIAYLEGRRVLLRMRTAPSLGRPHSRPEAQWFGDSKAARLAWEHWSVAGLTPAAVFLLGDSPELRCQPLTTDNVRVLNQAAQARRGTDAAFVMRLERFVKLYGPTRDRTLRAEQEDLWEE
jgi:hypothetical protein